MERPQWEPNQRRCKRSHLYLFSYDSFACRVFACVWVCKRANDRRLFIVFFLFCIKQFQLYLFVCCLIIFSASFVLKGKSWNDDTSIDIHTILFMLAVWRCDKFTQTNRKTDHHKSQQSKVKKQRSNNVISTFNNNLLGIGFHFVRAQSYRFSAI